MKLSALTQFLPQRKQLFNTSRIKFLVSNKKILLRGISALGIGLIVIPLLLFITSVFVTKYAKTQQKIEAYTASDLKFRSQKKAFSAKEKPSFKIYVGEIQHVDNSPKGRLQRLFSIIPSAQADDTRLPEIKAVMSHKNRNDYQLPVEISQSSSNEVEIKVSNIVSYRPGRYHLTITSGTRNIEQDFVWGVLAVNTNKSIYSPGETAKIGMAILDDHGRTKCLTGDTPFMVGKAWLTVTSPSGVKKSFSTEDKTIGGSSACDDHSVTDEADFHTTYKTNEVGIYQMHLIGENQNGKRTLDDYFEVKENQAFSIERTPHSMRIYPYSLYTNSFTVKANQDFTGVVTEVVPASFVITCKECNVSGANALDKTNYQPSDRKAVHNLSWQVTLKKGETRTLSYTYDAPKISPEFYLIGPLSLTEENSTTPLFEEIRQWQIASDAVRTWDGGDVVNNDWNDATNWSGDVLCGSTDVCTFDNTSDEVANINVSITPDGIDVNSGYDGTITQQSTNTITTDTISGIAIDSGTFTGGSGAITTNSGGLKQGAGTWSGGSGAFSGTNSEYSITGGTHTTTSSTISIERNFEVRNTTWTNSASTITMSGSSADAGDDTIIECDADIGTNFRIAKIAATQSLIVGLNCIISFSTVSGTSAMESFWTKGNTTIATGAGTLTITGAVTTEASNSAQLFNYGTISVQTNFDNTGGALVNGGTINLTGSSADAADDTTFTCASAPGGNFTLSKIATTQDFILSSGCTITINSSSGFTAMGILTNHGNLTISGASTAITVSTGDVTNDGTMSVASSATLTVERNFNNTGGTLTNSATIVLGGSSADGSDDTTFTCNNAPGGTFNLSKIATTQDFTLSSSCTITIATVAGTSAIGAVTNNGTLTITTGTLPMATATFANTGTLATNNTITFTTSGSLTNTGTGTWTNGGTITLATGSITNSSSNSFINSGTISTRGNIDNTGSTFTNTSGTVTILNTSASDTTTFTCKNTIGGTFNLNGTAGGTFILASAVGGTCNITATPGSGSIYQTLTNTASTLTLTGSNTLTLRDNAGDANGNITNTGTLTINSSVIINAERNFDNTSGTLVNSGTINLADTEAADNTTFTCSGTVGGTVSITKTLLSTVTISSGCTISSLTAAASATISSLSNAGTISFSGSGPLLIRDNAGDTAGNITNTGSITVGSSFVINLERNFDNTSGTIASTGTINLVDTEAADNTTFTCSSTVGGTVSITKTLLSTVTISSGCTISTLSSASNTIVSSLTINGTISTTSGAGPLLVRDNAGDTAGNVTIGSSGSLTIGSSMVFTVERSWSESSGSVTTNNGTINFVDTEAGDTNTLTCGTGTNLGKVNLNKTLSGTFVLGGNCTVSNFNRIAGVISNPASAYTLAVQGNLVMSSTTNMGGANMTFSMEGSGFQFINFAATSTTFVSKFQVNKTGGTAMLITNNFTVTGQPCTIAAGTFDINGLTFVCNTTGLTVSNGGNLQLQGAETITLPGNPTLSSGSTVTYAGNNNAGANTYTLKNWSYSNLTIRSSDSATDTFQPSTTLSVGNNLTNTAGTLDVVSGSNYAVNVTSAFSNAGTFLAQAGTATVTGSFTNTGTFTAGSGTLVVGDDFTNNGTFTAGTGTVQLNTTTTATLAGSGSPAVTFNNFTVTTAAKTVQFTASQTYRINGLLTITGTAGNEVVINSTSGTQWLINHQGTENVTYANVTNSGCDGSSTTISVDGTSINNGNNGTCWDFPILNITVSGNIYTDEGSTAYDCSANNISVYTSVNGAANDTPATCTLNTGAFSITATKPTAAAQPVVIFIDSGEAIKATTVTLTADATSNITGVKLYVDHLVLSHEDSGPMTNAKLATGDNGDVGILYTVASSNLTVDSGIELFVYNSKTYTPGGTVTTQGALGDFQLGTSATATLGTATNAIANDITIGTSATLNVNADTTIAGGDLTATGTLNTTSGTPTITMRGTGSISGAGSKTVYNLLIGDGTTATTTLSGSLTANNDVTVGTGSTLNQNASLTISGGDFTTTTTGIVNTTSGTGTVTITGTGNVGAGAGGSFTVYTLAANGTQTLVSDIATTNNVSVATGGSLALASKNVSISGGGMTTAGTGTITCTACSAGTVTISGTGNIGGGGTVTVYTLAVNGTQTLASDVTVSNTANVGTGGSLDLGSKNMTVNGGAFTTTTTGIIACSGCNAGTLTMSGTGSLGGGNGNITIYNLTTSGTGTTTFSGGGTNTVSNNVTVGAGTTFNINSTVGITGSLANTTTGIIGTTSGTPTVTVSGTTLGGGSGDITFYNLTKAGAGTTTFSGSGTNSITNNLSISNGTLTLSNILAVTNDGLVSSGATFNINASLTISGGDLTTAGTGVINTTSGTPTLTMSGTGTLGSGNGNITFYNLTTSGTGTTTFSGAGTNTVTNNVSVGGATTLNINSSLTVTGNLTNTTSGVIGTTSGTPTVTIQGTTLGGGTTGSITFYNLTKSTASTTTFTNGGTNTINNNLAVTAGTFTQSDTLSVTNDIAVSTGATFNTNATLNVNGGDMTTAGTGVISTTTGTPTVTISGTGNIGGGGTVTVYNLTSSSGTQTIASATTINNTLTVNGTINGSSNLTVAADFTGTGTVTMSGGTTEQRVAGAQSFGTSSGSNAWSFATLIFSNSTGTSKTVTTHSGGSGGVTASTLLQVGKGGDSAVTVLDAGGRTWTLSGTSGTPFTVPNGTFTANTSTVSYTGNNGAGNTTIRDITYYNLTVNNGSETWNLASSPLSVTSNLTVTAGTLDLQTNSANIGSTSVANSGGISVSGTLTQSSAGTTTVKTSAAGAASIGGAGTITFYDLTIAPTAASGTVTLGTAASQTITVTNALNIGDGSNAVTVTANTNNPAIDVNGSFTTNTSGTFVAPPSASFTIAGSMTNNGTFTHNSGTVILDSTTTATLAGAGSPAITFNNLTVATSDKTVLFTSGETFRTNGLLTITGTSGHPVTIDATSNGNQWYSNHQGTESITYAAIQDSGCDGSSTTITLITTNTNNGNNGTCWSFSTDISGVIYSNEGVTPFDCSAANLTINLSVSGGTNYSTTCTLNTGVFSFTTVPQQTTGTPLAFFVDNADVASAKATTITRTTSPATTITGIKLYKDHLVVTHEDSGPITNANLATADNGDTGIRYSVASSNLTVDTGIELHVLGGKTYTPGGTVTTQGSADFQLAASAISTLGTATNTIAGNMQVDTGATLNINADTSVNGGGLVTAGTGVITTTSGTPTVTVSGTGNIGGGGTVTLYNLANNGTQALGSDLIANNTIAVATGSTLALNSKNVTVSGGTMSTAGTGAITCSACSAGTVSIAGTGTIGGGGAVTTYNLTSSSGTQTISSATTVLNTLTANGTINGSSNVTVNANVAGTGTISMSGGTFEQRVASAQNFGTTSGATAWTFDTLIFSNSTGTSKTITTQTGGSGGVTASTLLQVGKGGDSAATVLDAGNRTWTLSGTSGTPFTLPQGSITANTSTFSYTGNNSGGNTTITDTTYNNLACNNSSETYTAAASPLTVNGNLTVTAGTLDLQTNSLNVGSTAVANSGNIAVTGTLTQSSSGTTTVKTSASGAATIGGAGTLTFYNLTIAPTAASGVITLGSAASQTLSVSNNLGIGDGSNAVSVTANTNSPIIDVNGSFTINGSGTFIAPPTSLFTIAGNMTNNGTFTANSGTVTFDTTGTSILAGSGSPAITFNSLTSSTTGKTIKFTAGETFRTNGLITFTNISVDSTTASQWFINHQGTEAITGTTVTNSGCDVSSTDLALNGSNVNGGNNGTCWIFDTFIQTRFKGAARIGGNVRVK